MFANLPRTLQILAYEKAAQEYLQSLPLEHFMEATPQAPQRKITLESLDLLALRRPDVQVFNELLVQYPVPGRNKLGQVVPDNMVVLTTERIRAGTSYNVPLEPTPPFWVMEYVSAGSRRKDYEDSFDKYEQDLKVPYYLTFYPDTQDLTLYRHNKRRYVTVKPNRRGRYTIRELDLDVALLDGWVRFWHKGELLPLPADLQRDLDAARRQLVEATRRADEEKRRADELQRRADGEKRRADEEKRRADGLQRRLEAAERQLARGRPENR